MTDWNAPLYYHKFTNLATKETFSVWTEGTTDEDIAFARNVAIGIAKSPKILPGGITTECKTELCY